MQYYCKIKPNSDPGQTVGSYCLECTAYGESFVDKREVYTVFMNSWHLIGESNIEDKAEVRSWVNGRPTEWAVVNFGKLFFIYISIHR